MQRGEAFLLHAGDCAESFDACTHVSPLPVHSEAFLSMLLLPGRTLTGETGKHNEQDWVDLEFLVDPYLGREDARRKSFSSLPSFHA